MAEEQVLRLDVVVDVAAGVDVLEHVDDLEGEIERRLGAEELARPVAEDAGQVLAVTVHHQEAVSGVGSEISIIVIVEVLYRVTQKVSDLGWVDLEFGSSLGWWAGTIVTYCPSRMVEHLKYKST